MQTAKSRRNGGRSKTGKVQPRKNAKNRKQREKCPLNTLTQRANSEPAAIPRPFRHSASSVARQHWIQEEENRLSHPHIVDQAGLSEKRRCQQSRFGSPEDLRCFQRRRIDDLEIIESRESCDGELREKRFASRLRSREPSVGDPPGCRGEGSLQEGSLETLFGGEIDISRTQGEAVAFSYRRGTHDAQGKIEVAHHAPDYRELLEILLPEDSDIGLGQMEELRYDGADSVKMARSTCPTEPSGKSVFRDHHGALGRIHLRCRGDKDRIHPVATALLEILCKRSRIGLKIFRRPELRGIDEDRCHDIPSPERMGFSPSPVEETRVAAMECPHRGHEDARRFPSRGDPFAQGGFVRQVEHGISAGSFFSLHDPATQIKWVSVRT